MLSFKVMGSESHRHGTKTNKNAGDVPSIKIHSCYNVIVEDISIACITKIRAATYPVMSSIILAGFTEHKG